MPHDTSIALLIDANKKASPCVTRTRWHRRNLDNAPDTQTGRQRSMLIERLGFRHSST